MCACRLYFPFLHMDGRIKDVWTANRCMLPLFSIHIHSSIHTKTVLNRLETVQSRPYSSRYMSSSSKASMYGQQIYAVWSYVDADQLGLRLRLVIIYKSPPVFFKYSIYVSIGLHLHLKLLGGSWWDLDGIWTVTRQSWMALGGL